MHGIDHVEPLHLVRCCETCEICEICVLTAASFACKYMTYPVDIIFTSNAGSSGSVYIASGLNAKTKLPNFTVF
jgi:hypothetical protein